jgi:hypothetical protein
MKHVQIFLLATGGVGFENHLTSSVVPSQTVHFPTTAAAGIAAVQLFVASGAGLTHQVQSVTDPHANGARAEPDELVAVMTPDAVRAETAELRRLRQPHDAM